jgi:hypothetical protein
MKDKNGALMKANNMRQQFNTYYDCFPTYDFCPLCWKGSFFFLSMAAWSHEPWRQQGTDFLLFLYLRMLWSWRQTIDVEFLTPGNLVTILSFTSSHACLPIKLLPRGGKKRRAMESSQTRVVHFPLKEIRRETEEHFPQHCLGVLLRPGRRRTPLTY